MYSLQADQDASSFLTQLRSFPMLFWQFTEGDFKTLVLPSVIFGVCTGAQQIWTSSEAADSLGVYLTRLPLVFLFNWSNVFIFDLENQRMPEALLKDAVNKPWRPLPSGKITIAQAKLLVLVAVPLVFLINIAIGVWHETALLYVLTWVYNDFGGGDGLYRNPIVSLAFALFNAGSVRIFLGPGSCISLCGCVWIAVVSCIVLTPIHISDLRDQEGDAARRRETNPLWFGDRPARRTIASFVLAWSLVGAFLWNLRSFSVLLGIIGSHIAWRVLQARSSRYDDRTWKLWALWMVTLYLSPKLQLC